MLDIRGGRMRDGDRTAQLSNVALLYYGEGLTQSDIAKRLQVSRVTVVNMLREARDTGIVEIHVNGQQLTESTLARNLREKYGLQDVYIADTLGMHDDRAQVLRQIGRVAAMAFLDIVEKGDRVGVAWGETILALTEALPRVRVENVEVNQLIGSMISSRVPASENCTIRIASQIGADCYTLHAPAMVATEELANVFRAEPTIAAQLDRLQGLDLAVYSIGNVTDETHLVAAGMATVEEMHSARSQGAKGIIACRYIDKSGAECMLAPSNRLISAPLDDLRSVEKKLLVVCGEDRLGATKAALSGKLVTHLVIDEDLAKCLLH
jgi:DNA-binding transcriptional regulator LsrR (DeoR family)